MSMYPIIFAGGSGTRLWPVSRQHTPKQTHALVGNQTLLQQTYDRLAHIFPKRNIMLATLQEQAARVRRQLPGIPRQNFSLEPERRETAAALLLAVGKVHRRDPAASFVNVWSDAYIKKPTAYAQLLRHGRTLLEQYPNNVFMVGVEPSYAETGYGYIKVGKVLTTIGSTPVYHVTAFKEKPSLAVAQRYVKDWSYFWNPTILLAKTSTLLDMYRKHLPASMRIFDRYIYPHLNTKKEAAAVARWYPQLTKISVDYAILEKADNLFMLPGNFGWVDVGSWRSVKSVLEKSAQAVVKKGKVLALHSSNLLAYNYVPNKVMAVIGLKDCVVVDTGDALLVCHQAYAQDVKKIVAALAAEGLERYL